MTVLPTDVTDGIVPSVFHRDFEKNYGLPTVITDGTHRQKLHIPKRMSVTITDGIVSGKFPSVISDGIADG